MNNTITRLPYADAFYLAGLLHDIGKFYQRADKDGSPSSVELTEQTKELAHSICPTPNNKPSHLHVLWTAEFMERYKAVFEHVDTPKGASLHQLAANHHRPQNGWERIVQQADHYASACDRSEAKFNKDEGEIELKGWDAFKKEPLRSIFGEICLKKEGKCSEHLKLKALPNLPLALTKEALFPRKDLEGLGHEGYKKLWEGFVNGLVSLKGAKEKTLAEALHTRLWVYASAAPSSTKDLPDVSLFDHLRITGAFAHCLYVYLMHKKGEESIANNTWKIENDETPLLLVGADLSGIQSFIYDIASVKAAKNLKGRSFYLQQLAQALCQKLLDALGLHRGHVVYASGGGFYVLAPHTDETKALIEKFWQDVEQKLFEEHRTSLYVGMAYREISHQDLLQNDEKAREKNLGDLWKAIGEEIGQQKFRRYKNLITKEYKHFFEPQGFGGNAQLDAITGDELGNDDLSELERDTDTNEDEPKQYISKKLEGIIELGRKLRDTSIICSGPNGNIDLAGITRLYLAEEGKEIKEFLSDNIAVLNSPEAAVNLGVKYKKPVSLLLYGGNRYPESAENSDEPKSFNELAGVPEKGPKTVGFARLGVLRMDVDNLGLIFQRGLTGRKTLSKLATLSRSLDSFFSGYLNTLWEEGKTPSGELFKDNTFIVYSGGDDLFIVGRWDITMEFAYQIQQHFAEYTGHNSNLTLSGGLALVPAKYPIARAAELAADAEKAAKNHKNTEGQQKNSFCITGGHLHKLVEIKRTDAQAKHAMPKSEPMPLRWDTEWPFVYNLSNELRNYLRDEQLPMSFVSHTYALYIESKQPNSYRWQWQLAYQWARLKERRDMSAGLKAKLDHWQSQLLAGKSAMDCPKGTTYSYFDFFQLAVRLAVLAERTVNISQPKTQKV